MVGEKYPKIGIGVMIQNEEGKVLFGLRKGSHGEGEWCFPGGHLDFGETIFETAKREVKEEVGLEVDEFEIVSVSDDFRYIESDDKHYVTIGVRGKYKGGRPQIKEPDRCVEWKWMSFDELPGNLFEGSYWIINNYLNKRIYQPAR